MRRSLPGLLVLAFVPPAFGQPAATPDFGARAAEIVKLVRDEFFDAARADAWAAAHVGYARGTADEDAFVAATRRSLADLGASHTAYYTRRDPGFYALRSIFAQALELNGTAWESAGFDASPEGFVRVVFAGGPAAAAGLRRGDRVLSADGRPFEPVRSFEGRSGRPVRLSIQRRAGAPRLEITLTPRAVEPRDEWLEAQEKGTRVFRHRGHDVGYVPMFSCAGEDYADLLQLAILGRLQDAEALVIDFRDGWGGCNPEFINIFNTRVPVLEHIPREGAVAVSRDPHWRRPLVLLVNGGTRSGKEIVAYAIQRHRLGTIVGTRTMGAVLAGRPFPLSDGSLLLLAVADTRVDGQRLEGRGVAPDINVDDALHYANGADPQLDAALDAAVRSLRPSP